MITDTLSRRLLLPLGKENGAEWPFVGTKSPEYRAGVILGSVARVTRMGLIGVILVACTPSVSPSVTDTPAASVPEPTTPPTVTPMPTASPVAGLPVPGFITVNADALTVRQAPGTASEPLIDRSTCIDNPNPCERPFTMGNDRGYLWGYVLDGPMSADGYEWYLIATEMNQPHWASLHPDAVGWVAAGDGEDAWLVADPRTCPSEPIELADVTLMALTKLEMLHCLGGRELTLRGWLPALGSSEDDAHFVAECRERNPWLICGSMYDKIRPVSTDLSSSNYLDFVIDPASGVVVPDRGQWVTLTGAFDHPDARSCGDARAVVICRFSFVLISIEPS